MISLLGFRFRFVNVRKQVERVSVPDTERFHKGRIQDIQQRQILQHQRLSHIHMCRNAREILCTKTEGATLFFY